MPIKTKKAVLTASPSPKGRLAFTPTRISRAYFYGLCDRLTEDRGLDVKVTQREAFEKMADYAEKYEASLKKNSEPELREPKPKKVA